MNVVILEDEQPAVDRMVDLLHLYDKAIEVSAVFDSVKDIVEWLKINPQPDLIFMDIQVADGICFEVFSRVRVQSPVIFTTAYQEYALQAFKVNSIDYLLKPVDFKELSAAIEKFRILYNEERKVPVLRDEIIESVRYMLERPYKNRFVIKVGEHLRTVSAGEILYFYSEDKTTYLCTTDNRTLIIDYSLDHLMEILDNGRFFRINRQHIINREAITDIIIYSRSRLKIKIKTETRDPLIVSRDKVNNFKSWLDS